MPRSAGKGRVGAERPMEKSGWALGPTACCSSRPLHLSPPSNDSHLSKMETHPLPLINTNTEPLPLPIALTLAFKAHQACPCSACPPTLSPHWSVTLALCPATASTYTFPDTAHSVYPSFTQQESLSLQHSRHGSRSSLGMSWATRQRSTSAPTPPQLTSSWKTINKE